MPTIHVPETTYGHLMAEAHAAGVTLEELVTKRLTAPAKTQLDNASPEPVTGEVWETVFNAVIARAAMKQGEYPAGFQCDASRDVIYDEQLRRQL